MKVKELIELLKTAPDLEMEVVIDFTNPGETSFFVKKISECILADLP